MLNFLHSYRNINAVLVLVVLFHLLGCDSSKSSEQQQQTPASNNISEESAASSDSNPMYLLSSSLNIELPFPNLPLEVGLKIKDEVKEFILKEGESIGPLMMLPSCHGVRFPEFIPIVISGTLNFKPEDNSSCKVSYRSKAKLNGTITINFDAKNPATISAVDIYTTKNENYPNDKKWGVLQNKWRSGLSSLDLQCIKNGRKTEGKTTVKVSSKYVNVFLNGYLPKAPGPNSDIFPGFVTKSPAKFYFDTANIEEGFYRVISTAITTSNGTKKFYYDVPSYDATYKTDGTYNMTISYTLSDGQTISSSIQFTANANPPWQCGKLLSVSPPICDQSQPPGVDLSKAKANICIPAQPPQGSGVPTTCVNMPIPASSIDSYPGVVVNGASSKVVTIKTVDNINAVKDSNPKVGVNTYMDTATGDSTGPVNTPRSLVRVVTGPNTSVYLTSNTATVTRSQASNNCKEWVDQYGYKTQHCACSASGSSPYNIRPTLLVLVHGATNPSVDGYPADANAEWLSEIETQVQITSNKDLGFQFHVMRVHWQSLNPDRAQVVAAADRIKDFLRDKTYAWDVILIGHSRGGVFINDLVRSMTGYNINKVNITMLDVTALQNVGDMYPSGRASTITGSALQYDDNRPFSPGDITGSVLSDIPIPGYDRRMLEMAYYPSSLESHSQVPYVYVEGNESYLTAPFVDDFKHFLKAKDQGSFVADGDPCDYSEVHSIYASKNIGDFYPWGNISSDGTWEGGMNVFGDNKSVFAGRDGVGFASSWMVFASQAAITGQGLSIAENAPFLSSYTTIDKDRGLNVNVSAPDLIGVDVAAGGGNGTTAVVTIGNKQYGVKVGENDAVKIEAGPISIPVSCCKL